MENNKKNNAWTYLLVVAYFVAWGLPFLMCNEHHDCLNDECMHIWANGRMGACVEGTIDKICHIILFAWAIAFPACLMALGQIKSTISPFIAILGLVLISIALACIDHSKWGLAISLIFGFIVMSVAAYSDRKEKR